MADTTKKAPSRRQPALKERGRSNRGPVMFRLAEDTQSRIKEAAEAGGRSMSEELERRIEASLEGPALVDGVADAVASRLGLSERQNLETIFATLEEFEGILGGKDTCSFASHIAKTLDFHVRKDAEASQGDAAWFEDDARRNAIRAIMLKSVSGLIDNWALVQSSSLIPSVGWIIERRQKEKIASGEYERRYAEKNASAQRNDEQ